MSCRVWWCAIGVDHDNTYHASGKASVLEMDGRHANEASVWLELFDHDPMVKLRIRLEGDNLTPDGAEQFAQHILEQAGVAHALNDCEANR